MVLRPLLSVVEGPFESALGSLYEARAGVRVAVAWGFVAADAAQAVLQSMESLGGRVFGLVRR